MGSEEFPGFGVVLLRCQAEPGDGLRPLGAGLLQEVLGVAGLAGGLAFDGAEAEVVGRVVGVGLDIAEVELGDKGALGGGGFHHADALLLVHGDVAAFVVVDAGLADGGGVVLFYGGEDELDAGGWVGGEFVADDAPDAFGELGGREVGGGEGVEGFEVVGGDGGVVGLVVVLALEGLGAGGKGEADLDGGLDGDGLAVLRCGGKAPFAEGGEGGFVEAEAGGGEGCDGIDFAGGADGEFEDDGAFVAELAGVDGEVRGGVFEDAGRGDAGLEEGGRLGGEGEDRQEEQRAHGAIFARVAAGRLECKDVHCRRWLRRI